MNALITSSICGYIMVGLLLGAHVFYADRCIRKNQDDPLIVAGVSCLVALFWPHAVWTANTKRAEQQFKAEQKTQRAQACAYGCDGQLYLADVNHEAESNAWYFDMRCKSCGKVDSISVLSDHIVDAMYSIEAHN